MCRSIKSLFNYDPAANDDEVRAAALQFVRKISGFREPSKANELVFSQAVENITQNTQALIAGLVTGAAPKNREIEAEKARARRLERAR